LGDAVLNKAFIEFIKSPELYLSKKGINLDGTTLALKKRHLFPLKLLADTILKRKMIFVSPFTGRFLYSHQVVDINTFRFYEDGKTFFVGTNVSPLMQQPLSFINVYITKSNLIYSYDYRSNNISYPVPDSVKSKFLINQFNELKKLKSLNDAEEPKKVIVSNFGNSHIGHCLWQDISIFNNLLTSVGAEDSGDVIKAYCKNYYSELIPDFFKYSDTTKSFYSSEGLMNYSQANSILPIFLTDTYITENNAQAVVSSLTKNATPFIKEILESSKGRVVVLSIRGGSRACTNEKELYVELINKSLSIDSKLTFIIDGLNDVFDFDIPHKHQINKLNGSLAIESELANEIINETNAKRVYSNIGRSLQDSIIITEKANKVISPWGAGLVKYKWLCNKQTFIYGSKSTLSNKHIHRELYDLNEFRENATLSEYFDGVSYYKNENKMTRDDDYSIDKDDFINQALKFIFSKGGENA
jgi:thiol-disulfide isomerase/thioredoxin